MLSHIDIVNGHGQVLALPIFGEDNKYPVRNVTGLDPVDASFVTTTYGGIDGEAFQSSRRNKRNPVIRLGIEPQSPSDTVDSLRQDLYRYAMPKSNVLLRFHKTDGSIVTSKAYVESIDSDRFVKVSEATISFLCMDPDFYDDEAVIFTGNSSSSALESDLTYDGTSAVGFILRMTLPRDLNEFTIYTKPSPGLTVSMRFVASMLTDDKLTLDTRQGMKTATIKRGTTLMNAMYGVSPYSMWPYIGPGQNKILVFAVGGAIPYTVEYLPKYGAI